MAAAARRGELDRGGRRATPESRAFLLAACTFFAALTFSVAAFPSAISVAASPHTTAKRIDVGRDTVVSPQSIRSGGAAIQVDFQSGTLDTPPDAVYAWLHRAADAVSIYYGRFPVARARVQVIPTAGRHGIFGGTTWGTPDPHTRIHLGEHTTTDDLRSDWMMTHEFVHMAFPSVDDEHHWIEEGIATYVEPIARVQAGEMPATRVWGDMKRDMQQGEPGAFDRGLDHTHSWGRTYWGGAMFCLVADVAIRERTGNRKGLQDALRAIVAAGGTIDHDWPLEQALSTGDKSTGTTVLHDMYEQMKDKPAAVDLDDLWRRLGVEDGPAGIAFNDKAPLAAVRQAITARPSK